MKLDKENYLFYRERMPTLAKVCPVDGVQGLVDRSNNCGAFTTAWLWYMVCGEAGLYGPCYGISPHICVHLENLRWTW